MVVVQNLHRRGEQRVGLFPDPARLIGQHTQAHLLLWDHAGRLDLPERLHRLVIGVHLLPAWPLDDPLVIDEVEPEALGFPPLSRPLGTRGSCFLASFLPALGRLRPGGHLGAIKG